MKPLRPLLLFFATLVATTTLLPAQARTVTGTVTRATGAPIAEATVLVAGSTASTRTGADGRFTIQGPAGEVRLIVRAIGFTRKDAIIPAGQTSVAVVLQEDVFKLEEVVVSGQATGIERRNATTSIGFVSGDEVAKVASPSVEGTLYGKLAGVNIQSNSGAPGGGTQLQVRGTNTILGAFDPLYVVDGVIYSNARIASGRGLIDLSLSQQDDPANRAVDINPADIASIELLKGASASAIYGSKAANGVLIIKTVRGQAGTPRANVSQRFGTFSLLRKYRSRRFTAADRDAAVATYGAQVAGLFANGDPPVFDHYDQVWGKERLSYETVADFSGGTETTRYFVSGTVKRDAGIEPNTGFDRQALRLNVDQRVGSKVRAEVSGVFNRSIHQRGWDNDCNNFGCLGYAIAYTPNFVDLRPNPNGTYPDPIGPRSNPLQTAALARNSAETYRFTGGATLTWDVYATSRSSFRFVTTGGTDFFNQGDKLWSPNELFWERTDPLPGSAILNEGVSRQFNYNVNGVHSYHTAAVGGLQFTTSGGFQFEDRQLRLSRAYTQGLVPGQQNINQGSNTQATENLARERTVAFYGQEDVSLLEDRLLLSGGIRAERSSANGDVGKYYVFPRLSGRYSIRNPFGAETELKLRMGYGQIGTQPNFGNKFTTLATPLHSGINGFQVGAVAGSSTIKPERVEEVEGGVDATFWGGRANVDLTVYRRQTTDLLLQRIPAPSTGFAQQIINGGKIRNEGVELTLGLTPIRARQWTWLSQTSFTTTRSRVLELPVPAFSPPVSGFGTAFGVMLIEVGKPLTRVYGTKYDTDGQTVIEGDVGNTNPDFRVGLSNNLSYKSLNLSIVMDWQQGSTVSNLSQLLYDDGANSADYGSEAWKRRTDGCFRDGVCTVYIESASFVKVREISLGTAVPESWLRPLGIGLRNARVSVTGRDLFLFSGYSGLDPEVATFGAQAVRAKIELVPHPPTRSIFLNVSLGF